MYRKIICQHQIFISDKTSQQVGIEGNFLNLIIGIYEKPIANIIPIVKD